MFNVGKASDLAARAADLLGRNTSEALIDLHGTLDYVRVEGLIGRPDHAKAGRHRVFLFVNGRRIQDRSLFHALTAGYGRYLPEGRFPVAVVHLHMPPDQVDVNVHPTKAEVRFLHPRLVYDALYYATNRVLTGAQAMASMRPGDVSQPVATREHGTVEKVRAAAARVLEARIPGSAASRTFWDELYKPQMQENSSEGSPTALTGQTTLAASSAVLGPRVFFQFDRTYVVAHADDALLILDQHTAHERVLFEAVLRGLNSDLTTTQSLLFPLTVELDPEAFTLFEANADLFLRAGFRVREFGRGSVLMEGTPAVLAGRSPELYFRETLETLGSELRAGRDRLVAMASSFACRAAVKSGDTLSETEMASLFERLFGSDQPLTCPHGRPTVVSISRSELDRKFGRA